MARAFRDHRDSVAGRITRKRYREALKALRRLKDEPEEDEGPSWLDLTLESSDEEIEAAYRATFGDRGADEPLPPPPPRSAATIHACPLGREWRRWDMFGSPRYHAVPENVQPAVEAAKSAKPIRLLGLLPLAWEIADDDAAYLPMTPAESGEPEWRYEKGSPRHLHAETDIDGYRVHADWTYARKHGPGRTIVEIRIFVDGRLAGRGGRCGCSLGAGGDDLPAAALVGRGKAVTVDDITEETSRRGFAPELVAEIWAVRPSS